MLNLRNLTWNVYEITRNNEKCPDIGVGFSMLKNNIRWGREVDGGTKLDWGKLQEQWNDMSKQEQAGALADYFIADDAPGLWEAFDKGDRAAFDRIQAEYARQKEDEASEEAQE